jgi:hypothetical protein
MLRVPSGILPPKAGSQRPQSHLQRYSLGSIVHVVQLTLAGCCLTSRMKVHFSGSAHLAPSARSDPGVDASCVSRAEQGRTRTRSSRGIFAIGLPMLEAGTMPGSVSHSPGVVWDGSESVIRRSNRPRRRLVRSNSANLAGRVGGER